MHIYRRHSKTCKHRSKGERYYGCKCPIWIRGVVNGIAIREALSTRDWSRASKLMATREQELADGNISKRVDAAIEAFVNSVDGEPSTIKKYWRLLGYLSDFCKANHILAVDELTTEDMDKYQLHRKPSLAPLTWAKEFDVARAFFRFCENRDWCRKSPMRFMKPPRNPKPKERNPYAPEEFIAILAAADRFGRLSYDRTRAKAMLLLMYHYGLRIGDVAFFRRDSIRGNEVMITAGKKSGSFGSNSILT